jgi:hypothetical protein
LCVYPGTVLRYHISATSVLNFSPFSIHILLTYNSGGIAVNLQNFSCAIFGSKFHRKLFVFYIFIFHARNLKSDSLNYLLD